MIKHQGFTYRAGFIKPGEASEMLDTLWRELSWNCYEINMFGRRIKQPRLTAWCSDPGVVYQYSGLTLAPAAWHENLDQLRERLLEASGSHFNSVLVNAYRNGADSMGWHADNEPELGKQPVIASISLGAERQFLIRPGRKGYSRSIMLEHGSLLLMSGDSQDGYQHCVPKTSKHEELRINLTYRLVKSLSADRI